MGHRWQGELMATNHSIFNHSRPDHRNLNWEWGVGGGRRRTNLKCVLARVVKTYFPNEVTKH